MNSVVSTKNSIEEMDEEMAFLIPTPLMHLECL